MRTGLWPSENDLQECKKLLDQKEAELHELELQLQQYHHARLGVSTHMKGQQQEVGVWSHILYPYDVDMPYSLLSSHRHLVLPASITLQRQPACSWSKQCSSSCWHS